MLSEEYVQTHDGIELYAQEFGEKDGIPAVFLHGGPGAPFREEHLRFFDLRRYRVIAFHQRGCGLSRPHLALDKNTIENQLKDIETVRTHFKIDEPWVVLGNSWGTALAQIYAIRHPDMVRHLILAAVSFADQQDADHFMDKGFASQMRPEFFKEFHDFARHHDRNKKLAHIYYDMLNSGDEALGKQAAMHFFRWNSSILTLLVKPELLQAGQGDGDRIYTMARLFMHYYYHEYSQKYRSWIWPYLDILRPLPTTIIHGQYDLICPPSNAYELHQELENSDLTLVLQAGHFSLEPEFAYEILGTTNRIAEQIGYKS